MMQPALRRSSNYNIRFAWAEAMVSVCSLEVSDEQNVLVALLKEPSPAENQGLDGPRLLVRLIGPAEAASKAVSTGTIDAAASAAEKGAFSAVLLVIVTKLYPIEVRRLFPASYNKLTRRILECLLRLLKDKDLFVQDVCCMALCHLYNSSTSNSSRGDGTAGDDNALLGPAGQPVSTAEYVAHEVMVALMRERRAQQPAGYNVGPTASSAASQAAARAAASPPATTTPGAATGGGGAVAGGGGGGGAPPAEDNHIMQAAMAAAAELGVGLSFTAAGAGGGAEISTSEGEQLPQDYVVYSAVCKLAKAAKDASVLFAVLSLIKRDPTFGTGASRALQQKYRAPVARVEPAKLTAMLPMLYHARFDPNTTVRPVMRALWDCLLSAQADDSGSSTSASTGAGAGGQHVQLDLAQRRVVAYLCLKLRSPQWRDREASCLALEAFLPRRAWAVSVFPQLAELFNSGLKALDDVRDSTRGAAIAYMKVINATTYRLLVIN